MKTVKRNQEVTIEFITNGIIVRVSGRDIDDNYTDEKMYLPDISSVTELLETLELMPEA